jgi:3-hydroxyacyl-[acyl-carrier-protein] dehydratase
MNRPWHCVQNPREVVSNEFSADATPERDSLWFDGHFPGAPILPGIAQLGMVSDLLKWRAEKQGMTIAISSFSRVRFRQFILPEDTVTVTIMPEDNDPSAYKFRIIAKGQLACSGQFKTSAAGESTHQL